MDKDGGVVEKSPPIYAESVPPGTVGLVRRIQETDVALVEFEGAGAEPDDQMTGFCVETMLAKFLRFCFNQTYFEINVNPSKESDPKQYSYCRCSILDIRISTVFVDSRVSISVSLNRCRSAAVIAWRCL